MNFLRRCFILLVCAIFLNSCFFYAAYGVYRTIQDINGALSMVSNAMTDIRTVLKEGKDIKRAAKDGKLISSLADRIPTLIQSQVERAARSKINALSSDLKLASLALTRCAEAENLVGANRSYNDMADTVNRFSGLMTDLSQTTTGIGK